MGEEQAGAALGGPWPDNIKQLSQAGCILGGGVMCQKAAQRFIEHSCILSSGKCCQSENNC